VEFTEADDLRGARFTQTDLSGARFRDVNLQDARIVGALLVNADISGLIVGLRVNGIEVAPLIEAELTRLHPERAELFASDPDGMRAAWSIIEGRWDETVTRARALPESKLHERVDEEWSFVETLRHLVFVTDAWISRPVLGAADHYHPFGLVHTGGADARALGIDEDADPSLAQVLEARQDRMTIVRDLLDEITQAELDRVCAASRTPGYPASTVHVVKNCLWTTIDEEWHHHQFATRDLEVLERRS
jgi:uncharacterized protein YjbI with pentapeptide repeats